MEETFKNQQKSIFYPKLISRFSAVIMAITLLSSTTSCSKSEGENVAGAGKTTLSVNVENAKFNGTENINIKSSSKKGSDSQLNDVQRKIVALNEEFTLTAEPTAVDSEEPAETQKSLKGSTKAASDTSAIVAGVKYKLAVYDADGAYLTERDYIRNQEASAAELNLESNKTYTFVAYSLNNAGNLPVITFADPNNKTLDNSSVSGINVSSDLMYFKKTMQMSSGVTNYLGIVFSHKFSQVNVTMDATATGYNITALAANFDSNYPSADLKLADGSLTRPGTAGNVNLTFSGLGTKVVTAAPALLNAETTTGSFVISNLTIGPLNQSIPANAISDLVITPGVKYNLSLTVNPKDVYLTHSGQLSARINGKIWMRYNLGAGNTRDPDVVPYISDQHGYYYQWGKRPPVAARAANSTNASWSATPASANNSWNLGTAAAPIKNTTNDPCPAGFRVPSVAEYQDMINWTVQSNTGSFTTSNTNFTGVKIFTSKRNSNVKLLFPMQGYFSYTTSGSTYVPTAIADRGSYSSVWASDRANNTFRYLRMTSAPATIGSNGPNAYLALQSTTIRCIAE